MAEENKNGDSRRRVMVAIDESECSYYAFIWVLENLRESFSDSPLFIFTPQLISPPFNYAFGTCVSLGFARTYCPLISNLELAYSVREKDEKFRCALLEKAKDLCTERGVDAISITEDGDPGTAICDAVRKFDISLLVLGDCGLGKMKRALKESVSNYCVHNAKCPVLIVKKP